MSKNRNRSEVSEIVVTPAVVETTVTRDDKPRKDSNFIVYTMPNGAQLYVPKSSIVGTAPESLTIGGADFAPKATPKAKMTEEEKAAAALARKNRAPAEKAAAALETARKAQERADKALAAVK